MAYLPDTMLDVDSADELADLVAQLKHQLVRHHAAGTWAAPGGLSARPAIDPAAVADEVEDAPMVRLDRAGRPSLAQIRADLGECTRCRLHETRKSIVFGVGDENAPRMFVGEGPGEQEDRRGEPFVGPAGELLDKMIDAMGLNSPRISLGASSLRSNMS
jgi:DNA polymerase